MAAGKQALLFVNKKKQKNFLSIGVDAISATPSLQGGWFFWFFFCKKRTPSDG
jgi:hypothetical protein